MLPLALTLATPGAIIVETVSIASLVFLAVLGAVGAKTGGAAMVKAAIRVTFWGALAMAVTALIGSMFGRSAWRGRCAKRHTVPNLERLES